jgi:hypothetical protein
MTRLIFKEPILIDQSIDLYLLESKYPHELRLALDILYERGILEINSQPIDYVHEFYVLYSEGFIRFMNPTRNTIIEIPAEIRGFRITGGRPFRILINSKPLSRNEIHEIDRTLGPDDLKITWNINAWGLLGESYIHQQDIKNITLIPISIITEKSYIITRRNFIEKVLQKADMLKREFIEIIVEPIDLSYVKETKLKEAFELLLEKQKLLLEVMNKQKDAKTATERRGIIDEVRRTIEGLGELKELYKEIYKTLCIEAHEYEAKDEAAKEMSEALFGILSATFNYTSRLGVHTKTREKKLLYIPIPTEIETEFAIQQAIIELNYLIKLLKAYVLRI